MTPNKAGLAFRYHKYGGTSHMQRITATFLFFALISFAACKQSTQSTRPSSPPTPEPSTATETSSPHPNQVTVALGKTSADAARLNPRIAEAYSPATVRLEQTAGGPPAGFAGAAEPKEESPAPGMKWVIVIIDLNAPQGEFSLPLNQIRMLDQGNKVYRLVSFGGTTGDGFADLREYDKYKMVSPPKMIMRSDKSTKQNFLFAVAANAEGLKFEF
jgi:hypothetical protein